MPRKKKVEEIEEVESKVTKSDLVNATLLQINARLNTGVPKSEWQNYLCSAEETTSPFFLRRSSGILSLDLATGGGFPAGGITQIAGPDGVGKNALSLRTIAESQRTYGEESAIAWISLELPLDKNFAHLMGVSVPMSPEEISIENHARKERGLAELNDEELYIRRRSIGTFVVIDRGSSAKRLDAIVEIVRSNMFQLIVVDSIAAILTEQREDTPLEQFAQQSSEAFLVTEFQKKLWGAYAPSIDGEPNWTTLIVLNQVRGNRNATGPFARKWTVGGANALKHAKLGDIWLSRGETVVATSNEEEGKKKQQIGKIVKWEIAKGKAGFHEGPRGEIEYHWDSGFQVDQDLVDTALSLGTIVRTGPSRYCLVDPTGQVLEEFQGKSSLYAQAQDPTWFTRVYQMVLQRAGITCVYKL